jgi:hypothetical protein
LLVAADPQFVPGISVHVVWSPHVPAEVHVLYWYPVHPLLIVQVVGDCICPGVQTCGIMHVPQPPHAVPVELHVLVW